MRPYKDGSRVAIPGADIRERSARRGLFKRAQLAGLRASYSANHIPEWSSRSRSSPHEVRGAACPVRAHFARSLKNIDSSSRNNESKSNANGVRWKCSSAARPTYRRRSMSSPPHCNEPHQSCDPLRSRPATAMAVAMAVTRACSDEEPPRGHDHPERKAGDRALADDTDDERAPPLVRQLADVGPQSDACEGEKKRPSREIRDVG